MEFGTPVETLLFPNSNQFYFLFIDNSLPWEVTFMTFTLVIYLTTFVRMSENDRFYMLSVIYFSTFEMINEFLFLQRK